MRKAELEGADSTKFVLDGNYGRSDRSVRVKTGIGVTRMFAYWVFKVGGGLPPLPQEWQSLSQSFPWATMRPPFPLDLALSCPFLVALLARLALMGE